MIFPFPLQEGGGFFRGGRSAIERANRHDRTASAGLSHPAVSGDCAARGFLDPNFEVPPRKASDVLLSIDSDRFGEYLLSDTLVHGRFSRVATRIPTGRNRTRRQSPDRENSPVVGHKLRNGSRVMANERRNDKRLDRPPKGVTNAKPLWYP